MKKLQSSNKKNAYAKVDDDVFEIIQEMGLKFSIMSNGYFYLTKLIKLPCMTEKKQLQLHVFVWILKTETVPTSEIDHQDRNPSNNQFENLRLATSQQQKHNRGKLKSNTSGFIGICHCHQVDNRGKKNNVYDYWRVQIQNPDGKCESKLFPFTDDGKVEAAKYYDKKALEYFGEFAVTNFSDENP